MPVVMKEAVYQRVTTCWSCHATLSDMKSPSFSLFAELPCLNTVRHLGESPHFAWPMKPRTGNMALLCLVRQSLLAGEQAEKWERKAGMNFSSPLQPPWEPFDVGWLISAHALHWYKALPSHHPNSHCYQTCLIQKPHQESTHNIHNLFFSFSKELQIRIHLWASHICSLPAMLRTISFAHKAANINTVAEAALELKEKQSSQNERKKHETQKNLPGKTLQTTSSATWAPFLRHIRLQTH